jgi:hypothetical protein
MAISQEAQRNFQQHHRFQILEIVKARQNLFVQASGHDRREVGQGLGSPQISAQVVLTLDQVFGLLSLLGPTQPTQTSLGPLDVHLLSLLIDACASLGLQVAVEASGWLS